MKSGGRKNDANDIYTDDVNEQFPKDQFDEFPDEPNAFDSYSSEDSPVNPAAEKLEVYHYQEPTAPEASLHPNKSKTLSEQELINKIGLEYYCLALGSTNAVNGADFNLFEVNNLFYL